MLEVVLQSNQMVMQDSQVLLLLEQPQLQYMDTQIQSELEQR